MLKKYIKESENIFFFFNVGWSFSDDKTRECNCMSDRGQWAVASRSSSALQGLSLIPITYHSTHCVECSFIAPPPRVSTFHCNCELHEATCEKGFVFSWTFHCFLKKRKKKKFDTVSVMLLFGFHRKRIPVFSLTPQWTNFRVCQFVIRPAFHPLLTFFYLRYHTYAYIRWSSSSHGHTELGFCAKVTQTCIVAYIQLLFYDFLFS